MAVILAAGAGTRMSGSHPKPLIRVLGMTLLERVLLTLGAAGIERFRIVVSENRAAIEDSLRRWPRARSLDIELIDCPDWKGGNGHSAAAGVAGLREPFLLSMADHIFDVKIATCLVEAARESPKSVLLATDFNIGGVFDLDDATKVAAPGGVITSLGKEIDDYDCIDVGLFYCPAWFSSTASERVAAGADSLSEIMAAAIERGELISCPIAPLLWQDVDTPAMRREATRRLLGTVRKKTDGPVSRVFNRPLSLATSRLLIPLRVSPNVATTAVFFLGMLAAWFAATPTWTSMIVAGVLFQLSSVWDGCDGEIARLTHSSSKFGAWYDTITDNIRYAALIVGVGVNLFRSSGHLIYLIGVGIFLVAMGTMMLLFQSYLRRTNSAGTNLVVLAAIVGDEKSASATNPLLRLLKSMRVLVKQDVLALLMALALILNQPLAILSVALVVVLSILAVSVPVLLATQPRPRSATAHPRAGKWVKPALALIGLGLLVAVLSRFPLGGIGSAWVSMGWATLLVPLVSVSWFAANTTGAYVLLGRRVRWRILFLNRVMGDGYNSLVPLAGVAGEPVRAHHLAQFIEPDHAIAVVFVDRLVNIVAGLLFSAAFIFAGLFLYDLPVTFARVAALYGAFSVVASVALVYLSLSRVPHRFGRWAQRRLRLTAEVAPRVPFARGQLAIALAWHLLGRAAIMIEILLLLTLLDLETGISALVVVTGVLSAAGVVGFLIPQGLGVAEAASVLAFGLVGFSPVLGLAFGLVRRGRMIIVGLVGVLLHVSFRRHGSLVLRSVVARTNERGGNVAAASAPRTLVTSNEHAQRKGQPSP